MRQDIEEDILIKNYLLGNLQQEEQLQIEERLFFDREYFQLLQAGEDDLIDDYVYGELSSDERERFENYFLSSPERYEALKIAKALKSYTSTNFVPESPPAANHIQHSLSSRISFLPFLRFQNALWKLPLAVATLIVIIGGLWLLIRAVRTPDRTQQIHEAQQSPQPDGNQNSLPPNDEQRTRDINLNREPQNKQEQYAEQQNREPSGREPGKEKESLRARQPANQTHLPNSQARQRATHVYAFLLLPGGPTRGGEDSNKVNLPNDAAMVNLQLPLVEETKYRNFQIILYSDDNKVIRTWNGLRSTDSNDGKIVSIRVPAELLDQQKYHIKLNGVSPDGDVKEVNTYYFRVSKR